MNIHKNARLTPQGRLLLVERITEAGWSVAQTAQAAGISARQSSERRDARRLLLGLPTERVGSGVDLGFQANDR
jgi:leucine-zipper of insertion element IS481